MVDDNEEVLQQEQAKFADNEDRVTDLMSHLLGLGVEERKVTTPSVANPSNPFKKRLGSVDSEL